MKQTNSIRGATSVGDAVPYREVDCGDINERLRAKITKLQWIEELLRQRTHQLGERVKELNCLYHTAKLTQQSNKTIAEVLVGIAEVIPSSWQYPEITCARIIFDGQQYCTADFRETPWQQRATIHVGGISAGCVEVSYAEEKPEIDEGPFLNEERKLIDALARHIADFAERRNGAVQSELTTIVLSLLNNGDLGGMDIIREILLLIKKSLGFEAAGIRLREGEDFPYYKTFGFPEQFVIAEKFLCATDQNGELIRDSDGTPQLECMCGNILCGRFNPQSPFFTVGGSFWTNHTTKLLATTSEKDRQARTRNRCNRDGYESVALIPLRTSDGIIGLLQLNDHRKDMFTQELIEFLESLGASIGIALARQNAAAALQKSEACFRGLFDNMSSGVVVLKPKNDGADFIFKDFNRAAERIDKITRADVLGRSVQDVFPEIEEFGLWKVFQRVHRTGKPEHHPVSLYCDERITGWRENYVYKLPTGEIVAVYDDVTERRQAEEAVAEANEQLTIEQLNLQKKNIALREVLSQIEHEKEKDRHHIKTNIEKVIMPIIKNLKARSGPGSEKHFALLESSLTDVAVPFITKLEAQDARLSPRETEICTMIKKGFSTKEIATTFNSSVHTVNAQRKQIRKKLKISRKNLNLCSYLNST